MILFKNVLICDPEGQYHDQRLDLLIDQGIIKTIGTKLEIDHGRVIEHENLIVSIGWFDSSVSFGEPGFEERQTMDNGLAAAASGGFTTIMLNPNNQPNPQDASGVNYLLSLCANHATRLLPVGNFSLNQEGKDLAQLYDMNMAGAVSFYDYKKPIENANLLKVGLQYVKPFNGILQSFPQDAQIAGKGIVNEDRQGTELGLKTIPKFAEELRVARDIEIARYVDTSLHIPTVTTVAALERIKKAKEDGLSVSCSVTAHHLLLSSKELAGYDTNNKVTPPLREEDEVAQLESYLADGTIDMITSDHTPLTIESKNVEYDQADSGTTGLETAFCALLDKYNLDDIINALTGGYKIFSKDKPEIKEGAIANLTLFTNVGSHMLQKEHLRSTSKNNIFLNKRMKGKVLGIYNQQKLIWNE